MIPRAGNLGILKQLALFSAVWVVLPNCTTLLPEFDVTVNITGSGPGSGVVSFQGVSPPLEDCEIIADDFCDREFTDSGNGGIFTAVATAAPGSTFDGWTRCPKDGVPDDPTAGANGAFCTLEFAAQEDTELFATVRFIRAAPSCSDTPCTVQFDVQGSGDGDGTVTTPLQRLDIGCTIQGGSGQCSGSFSHTNDVPGNQFDVNAQPQPDNTFAAWTGCPDDLGFDGSFWTCRISFPDDRDASFELTAGFTQGSENCEITGCVVEIEVFGAGGGSGTVTSVGTTDVTIACEIMNGAPGGDCADSFSHSLAMGGSFDLVATPSAGSVLAQWSGCSNVAGEVCTISYPGVTAAPFQVTATFEQAGACTGTPTTVTDMTFNVSDWTDEITYNTVPSVPWVAAVGQTPLNEGEPEGNPPPARWTRLTLSNPDNVNAGVGAASFHTASAVLAPINGIKVKFDVWAQNARIQAIIKQNGTTYGIPMGRIVNTSGSQNFEVMETACEVPNRIAKVGGQTGTGPPNPDFTQPFEVGFISQASGTGDNQDRVIIVDNWEVTIWQ